MRPPRLRGDISVCVCLAIVKKGRRCAFKVIIPAGSRSPYRVNGYMRADFFNFLTNKGDIDFDVVILRA
jgi:hypothetical protein